MLLNGLGKRLDDMHHWHLERGFKSHTRSVRTQDGKYVVRWCFATAVDARGLVARSRVYRIFCEFVFLDYRFRAKTGLVISFHNIRLIAGTCRTWRAFA